MLGYIVNEPSMEKSFIPTGNISVTEARRTIEEQDTNKQFGTIQHINLM